jgi:hypothetical protein
MTDSSIAAEKRNSLPEEKNDAVRTGRVRVSRRAAHGFMSNRASGGGGSSCYFEEYELGIGPWKATIVKTLDYGAGRTRFRAQYEVDPQYRRRERVNGPRRWRRRRSATAS